MTDSNKDRISFSTVTDKQTRRALRNGFKKIGSTPYAAADALFTYAYISDQGKVGDTFRQQEEDIKSGGIESAWNDFKRECNDPLENMIQWPVYFTTCAILYALRQTKMTVEREKKLQHRQSIKASRIYESYRFSAARRLFDTFQEINVGATCSEKWARPLFVKAAQGIDPAEVVRANKNMLKDSKPDWHLSEYDMAVLEYFARYSIYHNKNVVNPSWHAAGRDVGYLYIGYLVAIADEDRLTENSEMQKIIHATWGAPEEQFDKSTPASKLADKIQEATTEWKPLNLNHDIHS